MESFFMFSIFIPGGLVGWTLVHPHEVYHLLHPHLLSFSQQITSTSLLSPAPARLLVVYAFTHTDLTASLTLNEEGFVESSYIISTLLGMGGFSKVYKAQSNLTKEIFAVKIVKKCRIMELDPSALSKEVETLHLMQESPYVVRFETAVETPSRVYILTEMLGRPFCYDDGRDVPRFTSEEETKDIILQMISPIDFLHQRGIVHRDVKPENYLHSLASSDGKIQLKLIDFGMVDYEANIPNNPLWLGTLQYQSPEMVSQQVYDRKIDTWALGVITYLLLAGKLPFYDYERKNRFVIIEKIKQGNYERQGLSEEANQFISRLLAVDPTNRMSTADALLHPWLNKS